MVLLAPSSFENASRSSLTSTAIIVVAEEALAAITAESPTPPVPDMITELPIFTFSVLIIAPAPVCIPQPNDPRISSGASFGTAITLFLCAMAKIIFRIRSLG